MYDVQLGASLLGYTGRGSSGQGGFFGAIDRQQNLRREDAYVLLLLSDAGTRCRSVVGGGWLTVDLARGINIRSPFKGRFGYHRRPESAGYKLGAFRTRKAY